MIYWQIFLAFFVPSIIGYGGGPAFIPLIELEVVHRYGWYTTGEFAELLALGNALPSPITTKMAGYIGFDLAGWIGAFIAVFATVAPSLFLMIALLGLLHRHKDSPRVKRITIMVRPVIAVLLGVLTYSFFENAYITVGLFQTLALAVVSLFALQKLKIHPAVIITAAIVYGALFLS